MRILAHSVSFPDIFSVGISNFYHLVQIHKQEKRRSTYPCTSNWLHTDLCTVQSTAAYATYQKSHEVLVIQVNLGHTYY